MKTGLICYYTRKLIWYVTIYILLLPIYEYINNITGSTRYIVYMFFVKRNGGSQSAQKEKKCMACQNTFLHNKILKLFYYRKCTTYSLAGQPVLRKACETTQPIAKTLHCQF